MGWAGVFFFLPDPTQQVKLENSQLNPIHQPTHVGQAGLG